MIRRAASGAHAARRESVLDRRFDSAADLFFSPFFFFSHLTVRVRRLGLGG